MGSMCSGCWYTRHFGIRRRKNRATAEGLCCRASPISCMGSNQALYSTLWKKGISCRCRRRLPVRSVICEARAVCSCRCPSDRSVRPSPTYSHSVVTELRISVNRTSPATWNMTWFRTSSWKLGSRNTCRARTSPMAPRSPLHHSMMPRWRSNPYLERRRRGTATNRETARTTWTTRYIATSRRQWTPLSMKPVLSSSANVRVPLRKNSTVLAQKAMACHVCNRAGSVVLLTRDLPHTVKNIEKVTTARIPEPPRPLPSAIQKHSHTIATVAPISSAGRSYVAHMNAVVAMPHSSPTTVLATQRRRTCSTTAPAVLWSCRAKSRKTKKTTDAVPSLSMASPSIRTAKLSGAPRSCRRATTATGSVALTIAATMKHVFQSHWYARKTGFRSSAVRLTLMRIPGPASHSEDTNCFFRTCGEISSAASNRRGGMRTYRISSGFISMTFWQAAPNLPPPAFATGTNTNPMQKMTSVYGNRSEAGTNSSRDCTTTPSARTVKK
mmetsp:Transcript_81394/g.143531  ORF Transcript_81394/g.143531 Transcript_81394/m.143531 type:complete len:498 (+) Transcript_81394:1037-2530(+)